MPPSHPRNTARARAGREALLHGGEPAGVEIRRSARRRRTVSAYREATSGRIVVLMPTGMSRAEEARWVDTMVARVTAAEGRRRPTDHDLHRRATDLSRTYLGGLASPASVRWVRTMEHRWGSCTPAERTIRLSHRLQGMPSWVVDYVLLHELAHLLVPGHGPAFWRLLQTYPRLERAKGFLEGVALSAGLDLAEGEDVVGDRESAAGAPPDVLEGPLD